MLGKYIARVQLFKPDKDQLAMFASEREVSKPAPSKSVFLQMAAAIAVAIAVASCDQGLVVPDEEPSGAISGEITYLNPGSSWPPDSTIFDLRFVAMRFVPTDTADFLQLNRMAISNSLRTRVASDTFFIGDVEPGVFPYSGVAYRFSSDIFDWKPVGLYEDGGGLFTVRNRETTMVSIVVDFDNPPIFPPR